MRSVLVALGTASVLTVGGAAAFADPAIPLNGSQEATPGDADGAGFFGYSLDGVQFCWDLRWRNIDTAFAAHVHVGPRHVAGPVVIPLSVGDGSGAPVAGCSTIDPALAAAIAANPKEYYVNVHNAAYPAGAIRGQLKRTG